MSRALLLTIACMIMAFARAAAGSDASALFADGERAFAAGEYQEALRLFTAAREAGSTGAEQLLQHRCLPVPAPRLRRG